MGAKYAIPDFDSRLMALYNNAKSTGLWNNTYALSTENEYFVSALGINHGNSQMWSTLIENVNIFFQIILYSPELGVSFIHIKTNNVFCVYLQTKINPGPVSLTVFPSQFKLDGNFVLLSSRLHYRDRYKILYMARQLCCRGMCKYLLRSDGQQRSYGKAKFPSYLNCGQKTVSETGL